MEAFKYYGKLKKITEGKGNLFLKSGKKLKVTFEIAKRGEEKLLFNAIWDGSEIDSPFLFFDLDKAKKIIGFDKAGRKVLVTDLFARDVEAGDKAVVNGYAGKCEIGEKNFQKEYKVSFNLTNFLFDGNQTKIEETENGKRYTNPTLQLSFPDISFTINKIDDYADTKKLLKRQGGILNTSTLSVDVDSEDKFNKIHSKVTKLCQLLSVARSTFINWTTCKILDDGEETIYELHGNTITRAYHGNNLIDERHEPTVNFLNSAWPKYDEYETIFDFRRSMYGYIDTYETTFIESRSLSIAVMIEFFSSRWSLKERRRHFIDPEKFGNKEEQLVSSITDLIDDVLTNLKPSYKQAMLSKIADFNNRPLDWKLKRLRKVFRIPISDKDVHKFIEIRNSLAHSSMFPEEIDSTKAYLFMRHCLDRLLLSILGYNSEYFDFESQKRKTLEN